MIRVKVDRATIAKALGVEPTAKASKGSKHRPHQGARECARRMRQLARREAK